MATELEYTVAAVYGHCEIRAWVELVDGKLVGMGSKKTYDQDGNLVECAEHPTGAVATFPTPSNLLVRWV